jgi:hypothetical protein
MRLGRDEGLTRQAHFNYRTKREKKREGHQGSTTGEAREDPPLFLLYTLSTIFCFLLPHLHSALGSGMARRLWRRGHLEASKPQGEKKRLGLDQEKKKSKRRFEV